MTCRILRFQDGGSTTALLFHFQIQYSYLLIIPMPMPVLDILMRVCVTATDQVYTQWNCHVKDVNIARNCKRSLLSDVRLTLHPSTAFRKSALIVNFRYRSHSNRQDFVNICFESFQLRLQFGSLHMTSRCLCAKVVQHYFPEF
jgi:hypothetical protein